MEEMWSNIGERGQIILIIFAVIMAIYVIGMPIFMRKRRGIASQWIEAHPTASKVVVATKSNFTRGNSIVINSVDGKDPVIFYQDKKMGFYLLPGTHIVESTFMSTRPGLIYRSVTNSYGPTRQELTVGTSKNYVYTFDVKNKVYELMEH